MSERVVIDNSDPTATRAVNSLSGLARCVFWLDDTTSFPARRLRMDGGQNAERVYLTGGGYAGASLFLDFQDNEGYVQGTGYGTAASFLTTTRASDAYAPDAAGVYSLFSSNVPRITDLGLLVEEARTNSIRNNSMQGAVAGTPGTQPTNWEASFLVAGGTSTRTISLATVQGIDFIFAALGGTPAAATYATGFDATTQIAASTGQVWTGSVFVQKTAGDFTGFSAYTIVLREYDSGGSFLRQTTTDISGVGSAVARYTVSATLGVSTAYVQLAVRYTATGAAIGLTIGFGWPQLELGSFATSPIRTTSAAATRAADAVLLSSLAGIDMSVPGTMYAEFSNLAAPSAQGVVFRFRADSSNAIDISRSSGNKLRFVVLSGGVNQAVLDSAASVVPGTTYKVAAAWAANDFAMATSIEPGVVTDASGALPVGAVTSVGIGWNNVNGGYLNGTVPRVAYFPTRLANAQLQALTA